MAHTNEIDDAKMREIFDRLNGITTGEPTLECLAAMVSLYCGMLCIISKSEDEAVQNAANRHTDLIHNIKKNYEWYQSSAGHRDVGPTLTA